MTTAINDFLGGVTLASLPRLARCRQRHFDTPAEICLELPRLMTRYLRDYDVAADSPELRAGKMYNYILTQKQAVIPEDDSLLAGTTTTKRKGVLLHPDAYAITIWPELETIHRRPQNPFHISREEMDELNLDIFPFWLERTISEKARRRFSNPACQQLMERLIFFLVSKPYVIGHTIPNYAMVVNKGLLKIIQEAEDLEQAASEKSKRDFYQAVQLALKGVLNYAARLSQEALTLAGRENDPDRRRQLQEMSQVCRRVPAQPPRNFREAVNAVWLYKVALHQESPNVGLSPGRLDQVLFPVFRRELEQRRLKEGAAGELAFLREALELVGHLWLKICDHVPVTPEASEYLFGGSGSNQAVTLGGIDAEGQDAVNDLTYVMLRATELLKLRDPNVNARYHPDINTPAYLQRLCQVNVETRATPCFHNDKAVIDTLLAQGLSLAHARDYGIVGCVEPSSAGRTFGHHGAIMLNLPAALELALFQGKHRLSEDVQIGPSTTDPRQMKSYADFQQTFASQLGWLIDQAVTINNYFGLVYQERHPSPLLSALMEGCLEKGLDVILGGAVYNGSGVAVVGLAEVVDSLTVIEEFVFRRRTVSFAELLEAINLNWQGYEGLHLQIKNFPDRFGADGPLAKNNAQWLSRFLFETFQSQPHYRGGKYLVGYYTMTTHAGYGALSRALPSGRQDYETFPSGITPVSGAVPYLTDCLNFVANLDHTCIPNGQALNLKFTPPPDTDPAVLQNYTRKFAQCLEAYFRLGGLQVQFNIYDRHTLRAATDDPSFFVRVSGYSAYFKDLNPKMQEEIISRAQYDLESGAAVR